VARCVLRLALLVVACLLASCGGGGGGGDGDGGGRPRLVVSSTSFTFTATQGGATPAAQEAFLSVSGGFVAVGIESNSASGFVNASFTITGQTTGKITLTPVAPSFLAPGTHTGVVVVRGCLNEFCSTGDAEGSPVRINVSYTVNPPTGLRASPQSLSFTQVKGGAAPGAQTLGLSDTTGASYAWSASIVYQSATTGWLNVNGAATANGASLPGNLSITVNPTSTVGTLNAIIRFTGNGATLDVPVSYTVNEPTLTHSPAQMTFTAVASGSVPSTQTVTLSTANSLPVDYTTSVTYGAGATGWLTVPNTGSAPGNVTVGVSTTSLALGTYTATLTFVTATQMVSVNVSYEVATAALTFTPGSPSFAIGPSSNASALSQTVAVGSTAAPLSWTNATSNQPWLAVSPTSGTTGSNVTLTIDQTQLEAVDPELHSATVTFSYTQPGVGATTASLPVTLNLTLPKIASVSPYVALSGTSSEVILRGKGFNNAAGAALDFGGTSVPTYTVVSDTEIRVTHPAFTAGPPRRIKFDNSLNLVRSSADLVVVDPQVYAVKSLTYPDPAPRSVRRIVYDAERRQLLLAVSFTNGAPLGNTIGALYRYTFNGLDWTATPDKASVAGLQDFAMSPDGKKLLVTAGTSVTPYDPVTLAAGTPVNASGLFSEFLEQIVIANDGNALITTGSTNSGFRDPLRYSIADATFARFQSLCCMLPGVGGSANGSRVVVVQNGVSPDQPVFQYNATDGIFGGVSVVSSESHPRPALDRNATRILLGSTSVYSSNFQLLGKIQFAVAAVLSPNGGKAYTYESFNVPGTGRVHVYDLTAPLSGAFFPEIASPVTPTVPGFNVGNTRMTISPDGATLFIAGEDGILVMPAP
jgi:hypothetical protein